MTKFFFFYLISVLSTFLGFLTTTIIASLLLQVNFLGINLIVFFSPLFSFMLIYMPSLIGTIILFFADKFNKPVKLIGSIAGAALGMFISTWITGITGKFWILPMGSFCGLLSGFIAGYFLFLKKYFPKI